MLPKKTRTVSERLYFTCWHFCDPEKNLGAALAAGLFVQQPSTFVLVAKCYVVAFWPHTKMVRTSQNVRRLIAQRENDQKRQRESKIRHQQVNLSQRLGTSCRHCEAVKCQWSGGARIPIGMGRVVEPY